MLAYKPTKSEIEAYGGMLATTKFVTSLIGSAILVVQLLMVAAILTYYSSLSAHQRRERAAFIFASVLIWVTSSFDICVDIWLCFRVLFLGGPTGLSYLQVNPTVYEVNGTISRISDLLLDITIITGNVLMIWRCFVLWGPRKWVAAIPSLCLLGYIASTIIDHVWAWTTQDIKEQVAKRQKIGVANSVLMVFTSILVTFLILLRLAISWWQVRRAFPGQKRPKMYSNAAVILIESATPLAIFGVCLLATRIIRTTPTTNLIVTGRLAILRGIAAWFFFGFCALSPQMVIFRVTVGKSWKDIKSATVGPEAALSQPMHFASAASESADEELKSRI